MQIRISQILGIVLILNAMFTSAQEDSAQIVKYTSAYEFNEGIFLNFRQVKNNSPVPKSRIISNYDYASFDFIEKTLQEETIFVYDKLGIKQEIKTSQIWGYSKNGAIYVNWNNSFNRIPVIGNLCHFVANKMVYQNNSYDPYNSPYSYYHRSANVATVEMRQYLLDFETGQVYDYDIKSMEVILMKDEELFDEFNSLRNKKKKKLKFLYLRKYNERNPLFLPINTPPN